MSLKRFLTSTAVIAALTVPALSALAQDSAFYIVQDVKTKKCTIVDKKPVASEATVVGPDGAVYKTRTEAETAMKTVKGLHQLVNSGPQRRGRPLGWPRVRP